jgi:hypothetical protein
VRVYFVPKTPYTAKYRSRGYFLKNHNFFHRKSLPLKFWDCRVHILKMQGKKSQFFSQWICGVMAVPFVSSLKVWKSILIYPLNRALFDMQICRILTK